MISGRSFSERRKSGRFLPKEQGNYELYINGKKLEKNRMIDIGPDGLKIFSPKFNAFKDNIHHTIEFKSGKEVLFKTTATVSWRLNLRFPLNTCLIGFKIHDTDNKVAKFWVGVGYRKGFIATQVSNLSRFKIFHNLLLSFTTRRKLKQILAG